MLSASCSALLPGAPSERKVFASEVFAHHMPRHAIPGRSARTSLTAHAFGQLINGAAAASVASVTAHPYIIGRVKSVLSMLKQCCSEVRVFPPLRRRSVTPSTIAHLSLL